MAKKGFQFKDPCMFPNRCIAIDEDGVPWVIDPETGTIRLADVHMPATKQSATKKRK